MYVTKLAVRFHPRVNLQLRACHARVGNANIKREPCRVQGGPKYLA